MQYLCLTVAAIDDICFYLFLWFARHVTREIKKDLGWSKSFMVCKVTWPNSKLMPAVHCRSVNVSDPKESCISVLGGIKTVFSLVAALAKQILANCDLHHCGWTMISSKKT